MDAQNSQTLQMIWDKLSHIEASQKALHTELTRYKGFMGGVVATVTAVVAFISFILNSGWHK